MGKNSCAYWVGEEDNEGLKSGMDVLGWKECRKERWMGIV